MSTPLPDPICPWMGKPCPGVDNCAPALLGAIEVDGKMTVQCPITYSVSALSFMANRLQVLAESEKKTEKNSKMDYVQVDQANKHG